MRFLRLTPNSSLRLEYDYILLISSNKNDGLSLYFCRRKARAYFRLCQIEPTAALCHPCLPVTMRLPIAI